MTPTQPSSPTRASDLGAAVFGNFWTLARHMSRARAQAPTSRRIEVTVADPAAGAVTVGAELADVPQASRLLVLVHGLGGSSASGYVQHGATIAARLGLACLRVDLRGAGPETDDYYHAGLGEDLAALLAHPDCARFSQVLVLGYSLGGHVALSYALACPDPRQVALATLCSPLDLARAQRGFDEDMPWVYRRHVLTSLKAMYRRIAQHGKVPWPVDKVEAISTIYEWDRRVVAPRHGYDSAESYYRAVSVGPRLAELTLPTLVVRGDRDPMVVAEASEPFVGARCVVKTLRGGHVGFAPGFDLGFATAKAPEEQMLHWLLARADEAL